MRLSATVLSLGAVLSGCSESITEPDEVEVVMQVIEETEFASTLRIDLTAMTKLQSGVYIQTLAGGDPYALEAAIGRVLEVGIEGWLADGTQWMSGHETLFLGATSTIRGLEDALLGMLPGEQRLAVVPPHRAYGTLPHLDQQGAVIVPAGSIVILKIHLHQVREVGFS